jgi:hypothetical protein
LDYLSKYSKLWFFAGPTSIRVQDASGKDLANVSGSDGPWWCPMTRSEDQGGNVRDARALEPESSLVGSFQLKYSVSHLMTPEERNLEFQQWMQGKRFKLRVWATVIQSNDLTTQQFETDWIRLPDK